MKKQSEEIKKVVVENMVEIRIPEKYYDKISADAEKCLRTVEKQLEFMLREYYFDDEPDKISEIIDSFIKTFGPEEKKY